jgi:hypothetical protein
MSSEQVGAVRRCWAGNEPIRGLADWMKPKVSP